MQIKHKEKLKTLRREAENEPYRNKMPYSTTAQKDRTLSLTGAKRNSHGVQAGSNVLASIPSAKQNMELKGYTINPDSKYTSLAEVHQRGFLPRSNYFINKHNAANK